MEWVTVSEMKKLAMVSKAMQALSRRMLGEWNQWIEDENTRMYAEWCKQHPRTPELPL